MIKIATAVALFASVIATPAFATSPAIDVVNDSSNDIRKVQMSHIYAPDMGSDLLGRSMLPVGYQFALTEPTYEDTYCRYDLLITFDDGNTSLINDFNACEAVTVTVQDGSFEIEEVDGDTYYRRAIIA